MNFAQAALEGAQPRQVLHYPDLCRLGIGYSYTQLWRLWKAGRFPAPIKLGAKRNAWRSDEIEAWLNSRPRDGQTEAA